MSPKEKNPRKVATRAKEAISKNLPEHSLHDHLAYWLHRLSASVLSKFERELLALGITSAQWQIMVAIYRNNAHSPKELSDYIAIDAAAVSRGASRLLAKGLIQKEPHPEDRRSVNLALTKKGRQILEITLPICEEQEILWTSSLSERQMENFVATMHQLLQAQNVQPTGTVWTRHRRSRKTSA